MYGIFCHIEACKIISEKCMVTPNFLLRYQKYLLGSAFSAISFKPCKNIPVLVGLIGNPSISRYADHVCSNKSRHHP